MWLVFNCFDDKSSERSADAKTGSISIVFAILTGKDGPEVSKKDIILLFFSWTSIMVFRKVLEL